MLPISLGTIIFFYGKSVDAIGGAVSIIVILQSIVMILVIPATEAALKRNFDDNGKRR